MFDTPILFIVFNRIDTTKIVFDAIKAIRPGKLFIAADGPRIDKIGEHETCMKVRNLIDNNIDWPCTVHRLYRDENLGCGFAVSSAITWFFENIEKGIILEDDILPDTAFFLFCQKMLNLYNDNQNVMHIAGTSFQCGIKRGEYDYYFSRYPMIWGWATWRRAWQKYSYSFYNDSDDKILQSMKESGISEFGIKSFYNEFINVKLGKIDTWDYQWVYTLLKNKGICINNQDCLVTNIGFTEYATHTTVIPYWHRYLVHNNLHLKKYPKNISVDNKADDFYLSLTRERRTKSILFMKFRYKVKSLITKYFLNKTR